MQPTSPVPLLLALQTPTGSSENFEGAPAASVQRVEERPQSALAQGSYAWPAWAVIAVATLGASGALVWWLRVQRRNAPRGGAPMSKSPTQEARS